MCEPTTIAAVASYFGASAATASTIGTAVSIGSTALGAVSAYQGAQTQKAIANSNAKVADMQAKDARERGEKAAQEARQRGSLIEGAQRTSLSARGLDLSEGTPNDILGQTDFFTQSDIATARTNGRKEAFAAKTQAANYRMEAGAVNPGLTLLGGAAKVADKWYAYKGK
jgi:hypothetical protein